ncbi:MAG: signal transduction histidine kinase [Acidobacteria bacterium]|nr:signal transduction histidine kinase [Acidobacteriota bacterium]
MNPLDLSFQAFLESAPDAIVVVNREGTIVGINALTEEMFGYRRDEIIGQRVELLVPDRFRAQHNGDRARYSQAPRTRPMGLDRELWGRRKSGQEFLVQISLSPIETASGTLVTSIIRDVTTQRAAEARFRALLESAPDGIVVVDATGTIVIVNSQTERLFNYTREELIGHPIEMLVPQRYRGAHVGDRDAYTADPKLRPMGAGRALTGLTKEGIEFPVEISLSPLVTDQGRLVMSIIRDITERRRAEEIIQTSLREKEALLKEIHHRVKNNLQVTSSLLRLQAAAIGDERVRAMFEETENRIRSMALVHEKLYQSTNLSRIDFGDYIRTLGELLFRGSAIDPDNVVLEVGGAKIFLSIETAVPCGLIVNELLSNSLKHAFPDGRRGTISVRLRDEPDGQVGVDVRDDGIGLPRALEIERTETLGLRLVAGLVQQIDGKLTIERGESGAAFSMVFPAERGK